MTFESSSIVVTGADGFIGSHLVERLITDGARVRALCLYNSEGRLGWLDDLDPDQLASIDVRLGDIRDADFVRRLIDGADAVFHLAALIAIPFSYEAPRSFIATNTEGTLNVLEAVRHAETPLMIHTSTSEVYGSAQELPITEAHPLEAQSPYSASKIAADKLCQAYALSFHTPVITLRPFNTYGPRQSLRAVIPTILAQLLAGQTQIRLGNLSPQRDFTYVADTVEGFIRMASASPSAGTTVHLGSGKAVSIRDLLQLCCDILEIDAEPEWDEPRARPSDSEVDILQSDPSLAAEMLGWKASIPLREGLASTAKWLADRPELARATTYHK